MSIRALVVDDSVVFRQAVSRALSAIDDVEVVGVAANGKLALSRIAELRPDLVTLDIEMPEMNGIEVLQAIAAAGGQRPDFVMLSSQTARGGTLTMRALDLGAFEFVPKPEGDGTDRNIGDLRSALLPVIRALECRRHVRGAAGAPTTRTAALTPPQRVRRVPHMDPPIVLIGVSTGGPVALSTLIPSLPKNLGAPVFIVQHMPPMFTAPLAASLAGRSAIEVREASDGEEARANCAYIAPGGRHMKITPGTRGEVVVRITTDPPENHCRPAVDYLFRSAALHFPGRAIAAVLTGMGRDGTEGLKMLRRGGCLAVAQDEASCVVFGMPKEAIEAGVVDQVAPLDSIAGILSQWVREGLA
jgi:two-component system chemotaxis response regulator CheB